MAGAKGENSGRRGRKVAVPDGVGPVRQEKDFGFRSEGNGEL